LGDAWITQASRLDHAWITLGLNGTSALFATKAQKWGVGKEDRVIRKPIY
jgi:hypothetical protein